MKIEITGNMIMFCFLVIFTLQLIMFGMLSRDSFKLGEDLGIMKEKVSWVEEQLLNKGE